MYNNAKNVSTEISPFFANYGYHPCHTIRVRRLDDGINPSTEAFTQQLKKVHKELCLNIESTQQTYKYYYNKKTKPPPSFKLGDLVWLNRTNVRINCPSQKLDVRRLRPFKVLEAVGSSKLEFRLELSSQMHIHPVFHV